MVREWRDNHPDEAIPDGLVLTQPWPASSSEKGRGIPDRAIHYQYRHDRARRSLRGIDEQIAKGQRAVDRTADLAPSTKTALDGDSGHFGPADYNGRNLHLGVREAASAAAANGLALCGLRPFQAGFLVFSDFQRGPLRLGALMGQPVIHIYTHDSIGMGEDGPTHQPIEQLASLRAIPNLIDLRPADANEVREAWRVIMSVADRPVALVLSKQDVPVLDRTHIAAASGLARGAYVLADPPAGERPDVLIIATGSEVALAMHARDLLADTGIAARVVSMPSWTLFDDQDQHYRDTVLPPELTARVAVEAASGFGWERHVGPKGRMIAMHSFGASGPTHDVRSHFGFTAENIAETARELIDHDNRDRPAAH